MNKISLTLTSDEEKGTQVHLNVAFDSREKAVAFHAKIAALCEHASRSDSTVAPVWHPRALLARV